MPLQLHFDQTWEMLIQKTTLKCLYKIMKHPVSVKLSIGISGHPLINHYAKTTQKPCNVTQFV